MASACYLYHLYDVADRLLYVGMTSYVDARMRQHAATQVWWAEVDHRWVVAYPSRGARAAAEALTIHLLWPPYNFTVPGASRCADLTARSTDEIPAAIDVVVEVDEQRQRADRAGRRVEQLERALGRAERRVDDRNRKLRDLMNEIRRGHTELHIVINDLMAGPLTSSWRTRGEAVHGGLRRIRGQSWDIVQNRPLSAPQDLVALMRAQVIAGSSDRPRRVPAAITDGCGWE